ncbi:probable multidrug resistance-associated protein lethal(2)03659 isoform X2 [Harmonia axyridis]|nr:probable multidrug resistance-associated protein lethal(2)03659 isoform X2 [Harmonia axyridis]
MSTIVSVHYKFSSSITALKIRVACSTCIHKKILKMNTSSHINALNVISNDLSRLDRSSNYVHYVWGSPLFLISILNLLYYDVGISGLIGVLWFILYMIFQSYFAHWIGSHRNKIAKKTDIRMGFMNEILTSIKGIKMYAWEKPFCRSVQNSRDIEMKIVKKVTYFKGILYSLQSFINITAVFLALLSMVILGEDISASKIFKLIMYYYSFNFAITLMFPLSVTKATELYQVLKRVNEFLLQNEILVQRKFDTQEISRVILKDFNAIWYDKSLINSTKPSSPFDEDSLIKYQEKDYILRDINMKFEDGKLYGITGAVGSGKSTLLLSILGETLQSGSLQLNGSVSYASQDPWFFNDTIKRNILFDEPLKEERYEKVIRICGLKTDLDALPENDRTLVVDSGLYLSGGQKSRINLARAIYRNADIYLFDDPLSSVDASVAKSLMEDCMLKFLKDKCRLLVTHNVNHLRKCDRIVILNSGRIEKEGTYSELEREGSLSLDYLDEPISEDEEIKKQQGETLKMKKSERVPEIRESSKAEIKKKSDLFAYLTSGNNTCIIFSVLLVFIMTQTAESSVFLFISYWTHSEETKDYPFNITLGQEVIIISGRYLHIFIFMTILFVLLVSSISRAVSYVMMVMRSSRTLHNKMLHMVIHSKMTFFEMVDIGQILSRFSKDLGAVDEILPRTILESGIVVLGIFARILLIGYVNPYLIIVVLAFIAIFSHFIKVFIKTSKNIKRIEGNLMGPLLTQVRSTIQGLSTIRAVNAQSVVEREYSRHQDRYTSSCYMFDTVTHAFSFAVEFVTTIFISIVTISCFFMQEQIHLNGSKIGLAITQSMAFTTYVQFCIIQCVQANNHLVAVERINEYDDLPQESSSIKDIEIAEDWPKLGNIYFKNVNLQFGESLEVLKGLNFTIETGEKIGIVGRTGGGKSSLIASILKLVEVDGEILIDSKNIRDIPAGIIRNRVSVIPQDPVLFSGTLRYNLDPFGLYDDHILNQSLKEVEWFSTSSEINSLDDIIIERGSNLSIGQKQLICLARIIIRKNKIILIDEATSNLDIETDAMMQKLIRRQFADCTVLAITHRVSTVLDYDKIMLIDSGELIEFASPKDLLRDKTSKLYDIIHENNK